MKKLFIFLFVILIVILGGNRLRKFTENHHVKNTIEREIDGTIFAIEPTSSGRNSYFKVKVKTQLHESSVSLSNSI